MSNNTDTLNIHLIDVNFDNYLAYAGMNITLLKSIYPKFIENQKKENVQVQELFPINSSWVSKKHLKQSLDAYAAKNGFVMKFSANGLIVCNRHKIKSKQNKIQRGFIDGNLGCGCKFGLQLHTKNLKKSTNEVKKKETGQISMQE